MPSADFNRLVALAQKTPANRRHFFERLNDPAWVAPLAEAGFFMSPPEPEVTEDDEGRWIRYPDWPESAFLVRVAAGAATDVERILRSLPDTDNVRVHEDVVRVALQLPADMAVRLAKMELAWWQTHNGPTLTYPRRLAALALHLYEGDQRSLARTILWGLFETSAGARDGGSLRDRLRGRMGPWEYSEALEEVTRGLLAHDAQEALAFTLKLLAQAVGQLGEDGGRFSSRIWRASIAPHAQNRRETILDALIDVARDVAVSAAVSLGDFVDVLRALERYDSPLFARLKLHVLLELGDPALAEVASVLSTRAQLHDLDSWHEIGELLRARFGQLTPEDQERVVAAILAGPTDARYDGQEERDERLAAWRYRQLALIEDNLPAALRPDFDALRQRFGELEHPTFLSYSTSWTGPSSPLTVDAILDLSIVELESYLRTWEAPVSFGPAPSPEGLGRVLAEAVQQAPERFAEWAPRLRVLDPTYVRAVLQGLSQATKAQKTFKWDHVLDLGQWVLEQPRGGTGPPLDLERDPGWAWARKAVAEVISAGLEGAEPAIPIELRDRVWQVLSTLEQDERRTHGDEDESDEMDPATRSLNVPHGEALHAIVRYVLWVERKTDNFLDLSSAPEARGVLEQQIEAPSRVSQAVFGMWLAQLVRIDPTWVEAHVHRIFPNEQAAHALFDAAWSAYVVFTRPWLGVFDVIGNAYATATERVGQSQDSAPLGDPPDERLGEHLVWYVAMNAVAVDDDTLFAVYWARADPELRGRTAGFLGRMFDQSEAVPDDVVDRIQTLWAWLMSHTSEARDTVLSQFGWLMSTGVLDDAWLLEQARNLLDERIHLDPDFAVWNGLRRAVAAHPRDAMVVLRGMVQTDARGWSIVGAEEELREVLSEALESADNEATAIAFETINLLGARGHVSYGDLLRRAGSSRDRRA